MTNEELRAGERLSHEIDVAERKAVDAMSRYKFQMFGYWAAIWVHLNRISGERRKNPFACFVIEAKRLRDVNIGAGHADTFAIQRCSEETDHAQVPGTNFCQCMHAMFS